MLVQGTVIERRHYGKLGHDLQSFQILLIIGVVLKTDEKAVEKEHSTVKRERLQAYVHDKDTVNSEARHTKGGSAQGNARAENTTHTFVLTDN